MKLYIFKCDLLPFHKHGNGGIVNLIIFFNIYFTADNELPDSPEWKKNCSLLMDTPVHKALTTMREMGTIV